MLLVALTLALVAPSPLAAIESFSLFADFDGDHKLDKVELFAGGVHKSIRITLGNSRVSVLYFDSAWHAHGVVLGRDIDHDSGLDLIWASPTEPQSAVVWLGNGKGQFEIANDIGPYAAELGLLFGRDADSGVSGGRVASHLACALGPCLSSDLVCAAELKIGAPSPSSVAGVKRCPGLPGYLAHLRERGPPPRRRST